MTQYTPGPWEKFPPGTIVANPDQCVIKRREDFDWIASVQISNIPNWRANARLIAAAPELLEAAKDVVDAYGCECLDDERTGHCPMCGLRTVMAEITK